jgi:hypothetical protein
VLELLELEGDKSIVRGRLDRPNSHPKGVGEIDDTSSTGVFASGSLLVFNETGSAPTPHAAFNVLAWRS